MSKYAIIQFQGKQYQVTEGDTLVVDRFEVEPGKNEVVTDVLLVNDGAKVTVGAPLVSGSKVTLKAVEHAKGDKIDVFKYKSKSRYRRSRGHRQALTTFEVVSIK
ncbi:MAG TPA: 50S ribosomal protein L21 [Patescibacteria group bacterium]